MLTDMPWLKKNSGHSKLYMVVQVPPPINGMTNVTSYLIDKISADREVETLTVSQPEGMHDLPWTLYKNIRLWLMLLKYSYARQTNDKVYFVPASDKGLFFNLLLHFPVLFLVSGRIYFHHHVFSYVDRYDWKCSIMLRFLRKRLCNIVLCRRMGQKIQNLYGKDCHCIVLNNSFFFKASFNRKYAPFCRHVGYISNISREKGIGLFMDTVRAAETLGVNLSVSIAGPVGVSVSSSVVDSQLMTEIESFVMEAPDRRRFLGPIYGEEKEQFYQSIDVMVFPSQYVNEAQPLTIYEALSVGVPVLATNRGCIPDQLAGIDCVFDEHDFIANAADRLLLWHQSEKDFTKATRPQGMDAGYEQIFGRDRPAERPAN